MWESFDQIPKNRSNKKLKLISCVRFWRLIMENRLRIFIPFMISIHRMWNNIFHFIFHIFARESIRNSKAENFPIYYNHVKWIVLCCNKTPYRNWGPFFPLPRPSFLSSFVISQDDKRFTLFQFRWKISFSFVIREKEKSMETLLGFCYKYSDRKGRVAL